MKKYGLQLRVPPQQKKQIPARPPRPPPPGFRDTDDDDVEQEISRHASKNRALREIEEQHKKAMEEDPLVFDYDGVYDKMKEKEVQPRMQDRQERKSKYIERLMEKAKEREREHEVVYERKLAKERDKEAHLYGDKDKYVTGAYKKKLAEKAKWEEEDRLRQLREEKDDVTKKSDLSDFYFNLTKNVAFGAGDEVSNKSKRRIEEATVDTIGKVNSVIGTASDLVPTEENDQSETPTVLKQSSVPIEAKTVSGVIPKSILEGTAIDQKPDDQLKRDHHKRGEDQVSAAKERFLARKRAKEQ